jgi:hypothetical protein
MAEVDLRPMSLGEVLDRTFSLYKRNFWLFAGIVSLPYLLLLIVNVAIAQIGIGAGTSAPKDGGLPSVGLLAGAAAGGIVVLIFYFLLTGAAHAATIFAVSDLYLGRSPSLRNSYGRVGTKVFRILLLFFIFFLVVVIGFAAIGIVGALLRSPLVLVFFMFLGFILLIILLCRSAVVIPSAMLEDAGAVRAISRSFELTKGHGFQIFLIFLLVAVLSYVGILIFQAPFMFLQADALKAHQTLSLGMLILQNLSAFVSEVLVGPIGTIAFSLMYYNLRVRKEAFDVQHLMASLGSQPAPGAPSAI